MAARSENVDLALAQQPPCLPQDDSSIAPLLKSDPLTLKGHQALSGEQSSPGADDHTEIPADTAAGSTEVTRSALKPAADQSNLAEESPSDFSGRKPPENEIPGPKVGQVVNLEALISIKGLKPVDLGLHITSLLPHNGQDLSQSPDVIGLQPSGPSSPLSSARSSKLASDDVSSKHPRLRIDLPSQKYDSDSDSNYDLFEYRPMSPQPALFSDSESEVETDEQKIRSALDIISALDSSRHNYPENEKVSDRTMTNPSHLNGVNLESQLSTRYRPWGEAATHVIGSLHKPPELAPLALPGRSAELSSPGGPVTGDQGVSRRSWAQRNKQIYGWLSQQMKKAIGFVSNIRMKLKPKKRSGSNIFRSHVIDAVTPPKHAPPSPLAWRAAINAMENHGKNRLVLSMDSEEPSHPETFRPIILPTRLLRPVSIARGDPENKQERARASVKAVLPSEPPVAILQPKSQRLIPKKKNVVYRTLTATNEFKRKTKTWISKNLKPIRTVRKQATDRIGLVVNTTVHRLYNSFKTSIRLYLRLIQGNRQ